MSFFVPGNKAAFACKIIKKIINLLLDVYIPHHVTGDKVRNVNYVVHLILTVFF